MSKRQSLPVIKIRPKFCQVYVRLLRLSRKIEHRGFGKQQGDPLFLAQRAVGKDLIDFGDSPLGRAGPYVADFLERRARLPAWHVVAYGVQILLVSSVG